VNSPELIWDGELDAGNRVAALSDILRFGQPPAGLQISMNQSHSFVEVTTRSMWALVTWAVSAVMLGLGLTTSNWYLLALAPFMVGGAIMQSVGRICILVRDEQVSVFEGVGGLGRTREMALGSIKSVEYAVKHGRGGSTAWIVIHDDGRDVKFGQHLSEDQLHFVIAFLLDAMKSRTA
jgi:hypothetical protein